MYQKDFSNVQAKLSKLVSYHKKTCISNKCTDWTFCNNEKLHLSQWLRVLFIIALLQAYLVSVAQQYAIEFPK